MSSLAELPALVGFFSYSREDDEDSGGKLSKLRERIQAELRGQLGRTKADFRLWQDKTAIAHGKLWEDEIKSAIAESVFFIPIITPTAIKSHHCKFEFDSFLAREKELGRSDLVFPILYIPIPALTGDRWRQDPLLAIIGSRQYEQWQNLRQLDPSSTEVALRVEKFCENICGALQQEWLSPKERREAEARRIAEEERRRQQEAEIKQRADEEERRRKAEAEDRWRDEERRRLEKEAKLDATKDSHPGEPAKGAWTITRGQVVLVGSAVAAVLILAGYWTYHWSPFVPRTTGLFDIHNNQDATGRSIGHGIVNSVSACEQNCAQSVTCGVFAFDTRDRYCYLYSRGAELISNSSFISGVRR